MVDINQLEEYNDSAIENFVRYKVNHSISPIRLKKNPFKVANLDWSHVPYGDGQVDDVPDDKRGIYAFSITTDSPVLPPHGYILYIGIAGHNSMRSLRSRYKDYLNTKKVIKRAHINRMIVTWNDVLRFCFAPINNDVSAADLIELEKELNDALMPPFSRGDMSAELKAARRAFP
ncbi:MAG: hypothetical protein V3V13_09835 [Paracoccaceae bacterium]